MPDILRETNSFSFGKVLAESIVLVAARVTDHFYLLKRPSERALDDSVWNLLGDLVVISAWSWVLIRGQKSRLSLVLSRGASSSLYDWFFWSNIVKSGWRVAGFMFRTRSLTETILCSLIEGNRRVFSRAWKFALLTIRKRSISTSKSTLRPTWANKILIHRNMLFQCLISSWARHRRMIAVIQRVSEAKLRKRSLDKTMLILVKSTEIFIHGLRDVDRQWYASIFGHFLHEVRCTSTASYCTW